jgi:hypothetical protein
MPGSFTPERPKQFGNWFGNQVLVNIVKDLKIAPNNVDHVSSPGFFEQCWIVNLIGSQHANTRVFNPVWSHQVANESFLIAPT